MFNGFIFYIAKWARFAIFDMNFEQKGICRNHSMQIRQKVKTKNFMQYYSLLSSIPKHIKKQIREIWLIVLILSTQKISSTLQNEQDLLSLTWILNKKVFVGITLCKNLYWKLYWITMGWWYENIYALWKHRLVLRSIFTISTILSEHIHLYVRENWRPWKIMFCLFFYYCSEIDCYCPFV
jgi:hypothetical protein